MARKWYPVHKVRYNIALPDPDMPPGRLHHAILVQTKENGSGTLYHVIGDITSRDGMTYESKKTENPAGSRSFHSQELLGYTHSDAHPGLWNAVLSSLPTPPQQKVSNPKKHGRVEPFKEKLGKYQYIFYEPGEDRQALWKCTEWVEWYAIPALWQNDLIQGEIPSTEGQSSTLEWVWDEEVGLYRYLDETANVWVWQERE
ncbi:trehalose synthase (Ccg-9) [Purpureocillium lavendulum]|uniref:Trehalose synthase (Ccg-9) n=1 Tax=Purpureocillium lavendulum TaxID=1247861 RepID=A0AB34FXR8_9HYPO|nr:trehalose synthase (Ccg-9) [Purpureocillium lavendulum]